MAQPVREAPPPPPGAVPQPAMRYGSQSVPPNLAPGQAPLPPAAPQPPNLGAPGGFQAAPLPPLGAAPGTLPSAGPPPAAGPPAPPPTGAFVSPGVGASPLPPVNDPHAAMRSTMSWAGPLPPVQIPTTPTHTLSLADYASARAELEVFADQRARILGKYGLSEEAWDAESRHWDSEATKNPVVAQDLRGELEKFRAHWRDVAQWASR